MKTDRPTGTLTLAHTVHAVHGTNCGWHYLVQTFFPRPKHLQLGTDRQVSKHYCFFFLFFLGKNLSLYISLTLSFWGSGFSTIIRRHRLVSLYDSFTFRIRDTCTHNYYSTSSAAWQWGRVVMFSYRFLFFRHMRKKNTLNKEYVE